MTPILAALALAAPITPAAARPLPAPAVAVANSADQLVLMIADDESIARLSAQAFDQGFSAQLATDPKTKAALDADPGLRDRVSSTVRTQFVSIMRGGLPDLRRQLAALVTASMTPAEIGDTITFFQSPAGQKLRKQVYQTMGQQAGKDMAAQQQQVMAAVMASLTPDDYPALMAFGASPASQKLQALNPKIQATSTAWATKLVTDNQARLRALAVRTTTDYLGKKK